MRYGPDDKFWVVTDPTPESEIADICFETTLRGLELQFRGGLTVAQNPTMFTDREEAEHEAKLRLAAMGAAQEIVRAVYGNPGASVARIEGYEANGGRVFKAKLVDPHG